MPFFCYGYTKLPTAYDRRSGSFEFFIHFTFSILGAIQFAATADFI